MRARERHAILLLVCCIAVVACGGSKPRRKQRARLTPAPVERLQVTATVTVHLMPIDGAPRRRKMTVDLVVDRNVGLHAMVHTSDGDVHVTCDRTRAWVITPGACRLEMSCDDAIKAWFDIGWGYSEVARFILGEIPASPGWEIKHRYDLRYAVFPIGSTLAYRTPLSFPWVNIGWSSEIPDRVDLAPAIERARATPLCP